MGKQKIETVIGNKNLKYTGRNGILGKDRVVKYYYKPNYEFNLSELVVYISDTVKKNNQGNYTQHNFSVILQVRANGPENNFYRPHTISKEIHLYRNGKKRTKLTDFSKKFEKEVDNTLHLIETTELEDICKNILGLKPVEIKSINSYYLENTEYITNAFKRLGREEELITWAIDNAVTEYIPEAIDDIFLF